MAYMYLAPAVFVQVSNGFQSWPIIAICYRFLKSHELQSHDPGVLVLCTSQRHGRNLGEYFLRMAPELKKDGILALVRLTELAIRALPHEAPLMMRPFVEWIISHVLIEAETCTTPMLTSAEFVVISRVILFLPDLVREMIQSLATLAVQRFASGDTSFGFLVPAGAQPNLDPGIIWAKLIDLWVARFATFVAPAKRKVMAAAFASLFPSAER